MYPPMRDSVGALQTEAVVEPSAVLGSEASCHFDGTTGDMLDERMPAALVKGSGLSYAEQMLHDTLQMTRRSVSSAKQTHELGLGKIAANRHTGSPQPSADVMLRPSTTGLLRGCTMHPGMGRSCTWGRKTCGMHTVPKPFKLEVDIRAKSPRIAARKKQQA